MPAWLWAAVSGGIPLATALIGLVRYRMRLAFLRHIYDRCGDRRDLEAAGRALAPVWPTLGRNRQPAPCTFADVPPVSLRSAPDSADESSTS